MRVYLVRHGEVAPRGESTERSLTKRGQEETEKTAEFIGRLGAKVRAIEHSGKLRAQQTAEILARKVESDEGVVEVEELMPNDDVRPWVLTLSGLEEDVMLVGHLPFMSRLASTLLSGKGDAGIVKFTPSSVLCLERDSEGSWFISFHIHPSIL